MNNTAKELTKLEDEIKALKNAFQQTALQLPVFTYTINYTTLVNNITIKQSGYPDYSFEGVARVVVTFTSSMGANALATLEVSWDDGGIGMTDYKVRRVPYAGGARWIVYNSPINSTIDYTFTVHSAVQGTLGAKMIWQ